MIPENCNWCGEPLDKDMGNNGDIVTVIEGEPHRDSKIIAAFHQGVCFSEASDYGW